MLTRRDDLSPDTVRFELRAPDGADLPAWEAGAHVDVVIAPGIPAAVFAGGRSGGPLGLRARRAARGGGARRVDADAPGVPGGAARLRLAPAQPLPARRGAPFTLLMGGGIGVTPLLTMAHRLHALGRDFRLHYSARATAPFWPEIAARPGRRAALHLSGAGGRADLARADPDWREGARLYTCGGAAYMDAVFAAALARGWPEEALSREYFSVPEPPPYVNHPFTLRLSSGALSRSGGPDGGGGAGAGRHRGADEMLGRHLRGLRREARRNGGDRAPRLCPVGAGAGGRVVLCCSRAAEDGATVDITL
jgi:ferredoxin-NADP reductase